MIVLRSFFCRNSIAMGVVYLLRSNLMLMVWLRIRSRLSSLLYGLSIIVTSVAWFLLLESVGDFVCSSSRASTGLSPLDSRFLTDCWREVLVLEVVLVFLGGGVTTFVIVAAEAFIVQ